jgi:hypothetical protein
VDKGIDASLGLEVALMTLQRLNKQGVLQAEVLHIPGVRGQCRCSIEIIGGKITSCVVEDSAGNRYAIGIHVVIATDQKKGPFSWSFLPKAPPQPPRSLPGTSLSGIPQASPATNDLYQQQQLSPQYRDVVSSWTVPVPLKRASDLSWPNSLSANEKVILGWVFSLVDGQRTAADIAIMLPRLRVEDVKNALLFLKQVGAITFMG